MCKWRYNEQKNKRNGQSSAGGCSMTVPHCDENKKRKNVFYICGSFCMFTVCVHCVRSTTRYESTRFTSRQSGRLSRSMFRAARKRWHCSLDYRSAHWLYSVLRTGWLK